MKVSGRLAQHDGVNAVLAAAAGVVARRGARVAAPAPDVAGLLALERRAPGVGAGRDALLVALLCFADLSSISLLGPRAVRPRRRRRVAVPRAAGSAGCRDAGATRSIWRSLGVLLLPSRTWSSSARRRRAATSAQRDRDGHHPVPPELPARAGERGARRPRDARRHGVAVRRLEHLPARGLVPARADRLRHARPADRRADRAVVRRGLRRSAAGGDVAPAWPARPGVGVVALVYNLTYPVGLAAAVGAAAVRHADAAHTRGVAAERFPRRARAARVTAAAIVGLSASGRWRRSPRRRRVHGGRGVQAWLAPRGRAGCACWRTRCLAPCCGCVVGARAVRAERRSPPPASCPTGASTSPTCASSSSARSATSPTTSPAGRRARWSAPATWRRRPRSSSSRAARGRSSARAAGADRAGGHDRLRHRAAELLRRPLAGPHPHLRRAARALLAARSGSALLLRAGPRSAARRGRRLALALARRACSSSPSPGPRSATASRARRSRTPRPGGESLRGGARPPLAPAAADARPRPPASAALERYMPGERASLVMVHARPRRRDPDAQRARRPAAPRRPVGGELRRAPRSCPSLARSGRRAAPGRPDAGRPSRARTVLATLRARPVARPARPPAPAARAAAAVGAAADRPALPAPRRRAARRRLHGGGAAGPRAELARAQDAAPVQDSRTPAQSVLAP